ncbi:hypothetical protein BC835DRAFT_1424911 [Cytidiella melzeri]|nr:hypothetical protein BC835DRAFT_1424911 [Cytidiella melzeri]
MAPTDTIVLNPALTPEHLEAASYTKGLLKLDAAAFANAGYPVWSPFTHPKSFIALSMALEGIGTSACTGAAQLILNKGALTTAASICAAEARHDGRASSAAPKGAARNGPYDMTLSVKLDAGQSRALALSLSPRTIGPSLRYHTPSGPSARTTPLRSARRSTARAAEALCMATGGPKPTPAGRHLARTLLFFFHGRYNAMTPTSACNALAFLTISFTMLALYY